MHEKEATNLFTRIIETIRLSSFHAKASLVFHYRPDVSPQEAWYILLDGTWRIDGLEDWQRYQANHGLLTPLH